MDGCFAVYAMGAGGEIHSLKREELQEIEEKNILHNTVIAVTHKIYLDKWILQYSS